ncbi:uncharacterized protein LOC106877057 [Octopus bimaculoides]|uniref:Uncharacterized protein n=1 Tax=Octopus bimaculoides TaxID=37653 RepID=A0A0L8GG93_OCTBM|nr:uncharacterized protein LOC106877057 [Octopus bimaculoides]|eukprot:XP_014781333.1 PREDICTED: uncharacterized protein LOC106877057 [Octopus bimaculoides]
MTIMNILSSDEENSAKSKQKTSKNLASPKVELNQQNIVQSSQKRKRKKKKAAKSETSFSAKGSETNKEKYFHVEKSIATSFRSTDGTSFSLLSLFSKSKTSEDQENEDEPIETREQYEYSDESSSSEECDETEVRGQQLKNTAAVTYHYTPTPVGTPMTMAKTSMPKPDRTFFFSSDDPRLSDGVKYFHRKHSEDELWTKWSSGFKRDVRNVSLFSYYFGV